MSDGFPQVREPFPGLPSQPRTPNRASAEAQEVRRQRQAEMAEFDQQTVDRQSVFRSVQSILGSASDYVQRTLHIGGAARRERAQTGFVFDSMQSLQAISSADDPEQAFADWWQKTAQNQYKRQATIQNTEQEERFLQFAEGWRRQQLAGALQTMEARQVEIGRAGITDSITAAVEAGDPEMVFDIVGEGRSDGFLSPAEATRMQGSGVNAAAKSMTVKAAQVIYDEHGLNTALQWIRDPDNHDARYMLSLGDLDTVARMLERQAQADEAADLKLRNEEMEGLLTWVADQEGTTAITYADIEAKTNDMLGNHSAYERVEAARNAYAFATSSPYHDIARGIAEKEEARRKSIIYGRLDQIVAAATPAQFGHVQKVLLDRLGAGDIAKADYDKWMKDMRGQAPEVAEAGKTYIRNAFSFITDYNAAGEQFPRLDREKHFTTVGSTLFIKGEEFEREEGQGDLLAVTDANGNELYRSLSGIALRLEGELYSIIEQGIQKGEFIDPVTTARQLVNRELVGLQEGTTIDILTGEETPYPFQVRREPVQYGMRVDLGELAVEPRERFPDIEAISRGISYVGPEGMGREALTSLTAPISSLWTGFDAIDITRSPDMWSRHGAALPSSDQWNTSHEEWRSYVDNGFYDLAAYVAADMLPRSTAALGELYEDGDIYGFRQESDGTFWVRFTELGREYPVMPLGDMARATGTPPPARTMLQVSPPGTEDESTTAAAPPAGDRGTVTTAIEEEITTLTEEWSALGDELTRLLQQINVTPTEIGKAPLQQQYDDINSRRQWIGRRISEKKKALRQ